MREFGRAHACALVTERQDDFETAGRSSRRDAHSTPPRVPAVLTDGDLVQAGDEAREAKDAGFVGDSGEDGTVRETAKKNRCAGHREWLGEVSANDPLHD